ncbi:MAG TPA: CdvA-like protein [Nitrososphaeraceae archaeon]|nr:CdvA-like protein [Nitrososphaeraceae archaeon]
MSELKLEFVGKQVKDMYGTFVGKVVGMVTDSDGSIESVGVDCGSLGLKQLTYEQLLVQGDYVIYIPRWRLDAQKLLRQKNLTLKRIKALQDIVSENDQMKGDAELVHIKYEKRLHAIEEDEKSINEKLQARLNELEAESKSIKAVLFDAKLQYRSNEVTEEIYQQISIYTNELLEHINLERAEINNVKAKLSKQTLENIASTPSNITITTQGLTAATESTSQEESAKQNVMIPQIVASNTPAEEKVAVTHDNNSETETNWLNQVISNE